ncbi:MAG: NAD-dependent deacylase [Heliobacteriaceae bacterium]|nr:NAD-dependent deacylase [Heliobacteriaceae bacterium]
MGNLAKLAKWLSEAGPVVVFTGAGASTESGLPDFRSAKGLWRRKDPRQLASTMALARNYEEFCRFYRWRIEALLAVQPNRVHRCLAGWEKNGLVSRVVTQNVDGFHQAAGQQVVTELHGTLRQVFCQTCGQVQPAQVFLERTACPECQGRLRPGVVLFGEALPEEAVRQAWQAAETARLLLVIGTSLEVSPANQLPHLTRRAGGKVVLVNAEPTAFDQAADLVLRGQAGEILAGVGRMLN